MAYTNTWITNSPLGSADAKTVDDEFRKLRVDLEERFEGTFITDVAVDPWVVKPEILGNKVGKNIALHHSHFSPSVTYDAAVGSVLSRVNLYSENTRGSSLTLFGAVVLPPGVTVTNIAYLVNRNGATNITCNFKSTDHPSQTTLSHATVLTSANGVQLLSSSGLAIVVAGVRSYYLEIILPSPGRLYGAEVYYDTPNCLMTL
jgi:hypothetical protein